MRGLIVLVLLLSGMSLFAAPHHVTPEKVVLAPGYAALAFEPPAVGTYSLPVLGSAKGGRVINDAGEQLELSTLFADKTVLLSFIYTNCNDVNGCPLATFVLGKVQDAVLAGKLSEDVRLVSLSFDRLNDSPEVLRSYADNFRKPGFDWQFLTAVSDKELATILQDYDQFIIEDKTPSGEVVGTISHILRVYLVDREAQIRNIYSVSFLHPDIIINDVKTISIESNGGTDGP